VIPP
jgi:hypothetical protein